MIQPKTILEVVSFLDMFSAGLVVPQLGNYALKLGCNQILIGTMGALYSASQLISGPMIGSWSDLKGRKPTLLLTLILCIFAYPLLGISTTVVTFFAIRTFLGLIKQTQLLVKALAPDYETDSTKQSVVFGKLAALSGIGMSFGPVIGGHIMEVFPNNGFTVITSISGCLYLINASLIKYLPEIRNEGQNKSANKNSVSPSILKSITNSLKESVEEFYKVDWTVYWDVFAFKLIITLCMGMYFNNYGLFLKTKHDATPRNLGYIIAFQGGISSLCTYFIGHINNLYENNQDFGKRLHHVFTALTIGLLGMALAPNIMIYILFAIPFALSGAVGRVVGLEMIMSKSENDHRGSVIGATSSTRSISGVVTPMVVGIVGEYLGLQFVLYFAALFALMGVMLSYVIRSQSVVKNKDD